MSFKSMRNKSKPRKRAGAGKLSTLRQCWEHFRDVAIPADANGELVSRARMVFYAGAAFYQDQILTIGDKCNEGLSDDKGAEILESMACELDTFAEELAVEVASQIGIKPGGRVH